MRRRDWPPVRHEVALFLWQHGDCRASGTIKAEGTYLPLYVEDLVVRGEDGQEIDVTAAERERAEAAIIRSLEA